MLFTTASTSVLGSTHSPIQWVPGALSLVVKQPGRETDHSPPPSAQVKECVELYLHFPYTPSWRGANLKHRDSFSFTFNIISIRWPVRIMKFILYHFPLFSFIFFAGLNILLSTSFSNRETKFPQSQKPISQPYITADKGPNTVSFRLL
jgi:hypothetical protein